MDKRFSKRERSALRDLAVKAHDYELNEALTELYEDFCTWGGDGMSAFDLNDKIHEFHNGISRELYKTYVLSDPELAVAIGIHRKTINPDELDKDLREKLEPMIEGFERMSKVKTNDTT
jgi:hypothetical protein